MTPIMNDCGPRSSAARWLGRCVLAGLFLLICGSRFWIIHEFGNATPYWDDWSTGAKIITSYQEGTYTPLELFESHNEHRSAYTQMLVLSLFRANRQWDPTLQMVAQAPFDALAIVLFVFLAGSFMSDLAKTALAGFSACLGVLPFGWQNTLWGDQSCFYFAMLFGIALIWFCWRYDALTPRWWIGALLSFGSLFTMASGVFPIVAVIGFLMVRLIVERGKNWLPRVAAIAILTAIVLFGIAIIPRIPDNMAATNFHEFFGALTGIFAWPCGAHWAGLVIQAPLILLTLALALRRVPFADGRWFVVIVGASFWIQDLATAWRRCKSWDASRYCDSWVMLLLILAASLYFFRGCLPGRRRILIYPIAAVWFSVCLYGVLDLAVNQLPRAILDKWSTMLQMENNVRQYLMTRDPGWLRRKIPFPSADLLRQILDSETLRPVLPSNLIGSSLNPLAQKPGGAGFAKNGYPSEMPALNKPVYGSYGIGKARRKGWMTLDFQVPSGTREIEMQVAGYPNANGDALKMEEQHHHPSYSIAPPLNPGNNWQTVFITLTKGTTFFQISAKDEADEADEKWIAFSMPAVAGDHPPGRMARSLTNHSFYFLDAGLVLLLIGALGRIAGASSSAPIDPAGQHGKFGEAASISPGS
ncbi:MAG TPA: hypothetical protein VHY22_01135 [Chthoniobacteraceae bacterium]|jgi:hypothetical protein|nr:hypothetical protein [Chthoniobacteraceae bacterium]